VNVSKEIFFYVLETSFTEKKLSGSNGKIISY
jgi:hypothetical protein